MSDTPQGPGWWLASDGKYYPPEQRPATPPPPPAPAGGPATGPDTRDTPAPFTTGPTTGPATATEPAAATAAGGAAERTSKRPPKVVLAGIAAAAVLAAGGTIFAATSLLGGGEATEAGPDALGVRFTLLTLDGDVGGTAGSCWGSGGYDDFGAGMDIRVLDQDNKLIGSGTTASLDRLAEEQPEFFDTIDLGDRELDEDATVGCEVAALVPLNGGADIYTVEIGRRGKTTHTRAELDDADWWVQLSLGP